MRTVKGKTEERVGFAGFAGAALYSTLITLVVLIVLCAILSVVSLKTFLYPYAETIICYVIYAVAGMVCGFVCSSEVKRLGLLSGAVGGIALSLILFLGGLAMDGSIVSFGDMLKNMGILAGAGAVGGIVRMNTKK